MNAAAQRMTPLIDQLLSAAVLVMQYFVSCRVARWLPDFRFTHVCDLEHCKECVFLQHQGFGRESAASDDESHVVAIAATSCGLRD